MSKKRNDCFENLNQDIIYFLDMCTEEDAKLFMSEPKNKKIEDFVRFISLGLAFNMRGVFLNVFSQYEEIGDVDDLFAFMETITLEQTKNTVDGFLKKVDNTVLKNCAQSIWQEKVKYLSDRKFELSDLFKQ